ncbi:hypothetical protein [Bradyrhizobium tropiciagri]|uniref:hypothetical protein n=1 Tax=Bradyrhizobium tropiciagri TaxID=312253 RepID=UPI000ABD1A3E|nr:hypothetical protein [Bradyrhizobium tropiciagri]
MRTFRAAFEEEFDDHLEAVRARRRAIVRREAIYVHIFGRRNKHLILCGDAICGPWAWTINHNGIARERFFGTPIKPPQPKRRKGKRVKLVHIGRPRFPR